MASNENQSFQMMTETNRGTQRYRDKEIETEQENTIFGFASLSFGFVWKFVVCNISVKGFNTFFSIALFAFLNEFLKKIPTLSEYKE